MCYFNNAKLQNNLQTTKYFMLKNQKIPTYSHEPVGIGFLQQEWVYLPLFLYQKKTEFLHLFQHIPNKQIHFLIHMTFFNPP